MVLNTRPQAAIDAQKALSVGPLVSLPVNPFRIAENHGLAVESMPLDRRTAGVLVVERDRNPRVILNERDAENRRRFTCAHELGHYIRLPPSAEGRWSISYRNLGSSTGTDPDEIYANEFAACLLMPDYLVVEHNDGGLESWEMAAKFGVSVEAMDNRVQTLRL